MKLTVYSMAVSVVALAAGSAMAQDVTLRVGTVYQPSHEISKATDEFARLVEEKSGGKIDVQVFYAEELGSEREMAEMTRAGGLEMVESGLPGTGSFVPQIEVMEAFYTYGDIEDLQRVIAAIAPDLNKWMEPQGFHLVGAMYQGPRNLLSKKPIRTLADMQGLRLRIPQTPLFVALGQAWGATPTAIAFSEAYTALENNVVDAVDGTFESMTSMGFSEVAKYETITRHNFYPQPMVVNLNWWNGLTDEQRKIIEDSAKEAADFQLKLHQQSQDAALAKLKEQNVEIIEPADLEAFRAPVLAAMDTYIKSKGDDVYAVYQKMKEVANSDQD
jgi:tripartite ATP-independent transporter DctP family solute receptor